MSPETIKCRKCGVEIPCESHHLLPKGLYGDGETHYLCPNCHAAFHRYLGHKYLLAYFVHHHQIIIFVVYF